MGYGTVEPVVIARERREGSIRPLIAAAGALALCAAIALLASSAHKGSVSLMEMRVLPVESLAVMRPAPLQVLQLGDDSAKNLPEERHWMTDGWPTQEKCPGPWCTVSPFRVYPDSRQAFAGDKDFPLAWGPCNIAIQNC